MKRTVAYFFGNDDVIYIWGAFWSDPQSQSLWLRPSNINKYELVKRAERYRDDDSDVLTKAHDG
ncbi:hypothetical protein EFU50_15090 [Vibrio cholerae]|nr:hypothetical protein [Vibrio cholerae]EGR2516263.1 hypothetical protein [Vibrio cholerae]